MKSRLFITYFELSYHPTAYYGKYCFFEIRGELVYTKDGRCCV